MFYVQSFDNLIMATAQDILLNLEATDSVYLADLANQIQTIQSTILAEVNNEILARSVALLQEYGFENPRLIALELLAPTTLS